jgi:pilus assembly protein TadC
MTLENLKQNVEREKEILREMYIFYSQLGGATREKERMMILKTIESLTNLLIMLNNSIPYLVENISPVKKIGEIEKIKGLISLKYQKEGADKLVTINEGDRKKFIRELSLSSFAIKKLRGESKVQEVAFAEFKKPSAYARISNRVFSRVSNDLVSKGYFKSLDSDLRKANLSFLLNTYVSMIFFTALLAILFSIVLFVFMIFFNISLVSPFFSLAELSSGGLLRNAIICLIIPALAFLIIYINPRIEGQGISKKINQELPFAVIHMSAIARSGIEPSQIFRVIALSKEYPATRQEVKKVINQVNVYGYDLVNSLKNSAKATSSQKVADLFNGLATTISQGGNLPDFLDKRSETLLFDYKIEKEKQTKMAETFMDLYISIVIAAPMIMMLLLVLMAVSGIGIGLTLTQITLIIISIVALINIVFLAFLHIKQTGY